MAVVDVDFGNYIKCIDEVISLSRQARFRAKEYLGLSIVPLHLSFKKWFIFCFHFLAGKLCAENEFLFPE